MHATRRFLRSLGLPAADSQAATSTKRFPDGAQYRVEIPSTEGPEVLDAVLDEAQSRGVLVHRISQGSGGMLLTGDELRAMSCRAAENNLELSLFARPVAGWDIGAMATASGGGAVSAQVRGTEGVVHILEDIRRTTEAGIRSVLITDLGVLSMAAEMRSSGELPLDLRFKASVQMGLANPVSIRIAEGLGADTYNVPTDLTPKQLADIRAATDFPLDIYIESPDDLGGFVRHFDIAEIVRVAAPVYLKFGLRNAANIYPSGAHLTPAAVNMGRERIRRAQIGLELLRRYEPAARTSELGAAGLAIPQHTTSKVDP